MNSAYNDKALKKLFTNSEPLDQSEIITLFIKFLPSYTLDYTAPAKLGLGGWLARKLPAIESSVFEHIAELYFQLGISNDKEFVTAIDWTITECSDILIKHGSNEVVEWLAREKERLGLLVEETLKILEADFQKEGAV